MRCGAAILAATLLSSFLAAFADRNADALARNLAEYELTAGKFTSSKTGKSVNYVFYSPKTSPVTGCLPVPLVVFFGGRGEIGENMASMFRQSKIFSVVADDAFQRKHPCYLLAVQVGKNFSIHNGLPCKPNADGKLVMDAIRNFIAEANAPGVDSERIYITGLSLGGSIAFELPAYYPGFFAASVPVSSFMNDKMVPDRNACDYWLFANRPSFSTPAKKKALDDLARKLEQSGGSLKTTFFRDRGHNAWDKTWEVDGMWGWMFGRRLSARTSGSRPRTGRQQRWRSR